MIKHPYYPPDLHIEAGYIPNAWSVPKILTCFVACIAAAIGTSLVLAGRVRRDMAAREQAVFGWFILCEFFSLSSLSLPPPFFCRSC